MRKKGDLPKRCEVIEKVDLNGKDMEEKEDNLDRVASDVETVRQTLENLDFGGTEDGSDQVERAIEDAESITIEVFGREEGQLDRIQNDNQEFEGELQDRRGSSESDLGKLSDSSARTETEETVNELLKAKESVLRDIDFLAELIGRARVAGEKSDAIQEDLKARVGSGGRRM
jgi:hypothetical protein